MKIELTDQICQILETCPMLEKTGEESTSLCEKVCPLVGACLEYWTGDDTANS